jgi:hypothetical protein
MLLLLGAILVVVAAICWGLLAGMIGALIGLDPVADFLVALVSGILGTFPTVKAALWVRGRFGRPRETPLEELTEVF